MPVRQLSQMGITANGRESGFGFFLFFFFFHCFVVCNVHIEML